MNATAPNGIRIPRLATKPATRPMKFSQAWRNAMKIGPSPATGTITGARSCTAIVSVLTDAAHPSAVELPVEADGSAAQRREQ